MSYCRHSSDNWQCDIYAYEDCSGGYTIHVASNRVVGDIPDDRETFKKAINSEDEKIWQEYLDIHNKQMDFLETAERQEIGLPFDGERFNEPTLQDFKARLLELRKVGYNFPDYVLDTINNELNSAPS